MLNTLVVNSATLDFSIINMSMHLQQISGSSATRSTTYKFDHADRDTFAHLQLY